MGTVNVNRNVTDMFYRYKMPRLQAKVEGKGNGIKTVIVNMAEVARAIGRPATYPTKYFGCELGAQTQFDYKNERFIVNGSHDATKLQDLLDGFIRKFVLCPECDNPETDLTVAAKSQTISQSCKACGFHGQLKVNHKVNTFILKNPPTVNPAAQGSSLTEGKRSKRVMRKQNGAGGGGGGGGGGADNVITNNNNNNSGLNSSSGNHNNAPSSDNGGGACGNTNSSGGDSDGGMPSNQTEDDIRAAIPENRYNNDGDDKETWSVDVSKEAIRARMQDLTEGAKGMTLSEDCDKTEKERIDIFYEMVKSSMESNQLDKVAEHKRLFVEAERLDVIHKAPLVLAELLFTDNLTMELRKNRVLLLRFTHNNPKAQRYLIGGLEQTIALHKEKLMPKVAGILKLFYDLDVLEEKVLLEWSEKVSKKYVSKDVATDIHEKAAPFINWLKEAEEEDSSSEEEEEDENNENNNNGGGGSGGKDKGGDSDIEIEYNDRIRINTLTAVTTPAVRAAAVEEDDDEEDINIDDI